MNFRRGRGIVGDMKAGAACDYECGAVAKLVREVPGIDRK